MKKVKRWIDHRAGNSIHRICPMAKSLTMSENFKSVVAHAANCNSNALNETDIWTRIDGKDVFKGLRPTLG